MIGNPLLSGATHVIVIWDES